MNELIYYQVLFEVPNTIQNVFVEVSLPESEATEKAVIEKAMNVMQEWLTTCKPEVRQIKF